MKKILLSFFTIALLAAACGSSSTTTSVTNQSSPASGGETTVAAPTPSSAFTSATDGFTINFPGQPAISQSSFISPTAGAIPETEYRAKYTGGSENAYYTVYVYHYPNNYQFQSSYLATALQNFYGVVKADYPGSTMGSPNSSSLLGGAALSALITIPLKTGSSTVNTPDYVIMTTKNQEAFIISTYGIPVSDYNAFVSSFQYFNQ